jgi:mono/diheme cytochrome c family protein
MKRLGFCLAALCLLVSFISAQSRTGPAAPAAPPAKQAVAAPRKAASVAAALQAPATFKKYCFECHGLKDPEGGMSLEYLVAQSSVGAHGDDWDRVAGMLEEGLMPPQEATAFPTAEERAAAIGWIKSSLAKYAAEHAGEPGRVTVRRLTSGEYAYAIKDLTGVDIKVGIDASSDSVGGEGFANFGDVQFVQDANIERYLEAAKLVADHAIVGAGPLDFYTDAGKTGLELSALNRINEIYATKGFRVVSGEGGRPFGLERYGKAFYVAWHYKHRAALGDPSATIRGLAATEGITGRFADHVWTVVNTPNTGYPTREFVDKWKALPAPTSDAAASIAKARTGTDEIYKSLTTWPSWFFARGDLAAGGAGDESPLVFDDTSLKAQLSRPYTYGLGGAGARGRRGPAAPVVGPVKVFLNVTSLNPAPGVKPVVIWKNARLVTRGAPAPGRGGAGPGRGGAGAIVSQTPLRTALAPEAAAALRFGKSPDGSAIGPDDFAIDGSTVVTIDLPPGGAPMELQADAELGADRNAVVRLAISDRAEGSSRDAQQRVLLGDMSSAGYKTFRAGMAEYVASLPPNSHGEANPADKDPVPAPFDNTYNSPEHDAFINFVKYQRNDGFFTDNMVDGPERARLNHAWNDLFASWPYHDAYLGMLLDHYGLKPASRRIADMNAAAIAAQPADARPYLTAIRAHYDEVMRTQRLAEPGQVADALDFASRAWRRPLTLAEKSSLQGFYQKSRAGGLNHDGSLRALIARVLVSPAFVYRVESVAGAAEKPLNGWEIASRMSFFLWSSIPDAELRRAAAAGELSNPALLAKQVKRMTADAKARRFSTEFFGQWLGFYRFDEYRGVDTSRFPEFTSDVKAAMYDEAISTFEFIVRENRPVREVLYADYTFLNKPLADFYGLGKDVKELKDVKTDGVVKVDGAGALNRGGALRLGTFLTTTSAPLRTSPVKRGDWILRRILGTPTPPPPANAGSIPGDDKAFNGLTLRERLNEHKRNATCANCHLRIDPLGFPLEEYDAVGRTREKYADGKPVDTTGEFADKKTIVGTAGLLKYLQTQDQQVMTTASKKMLGYALGRTILASDRPLLDQMVALGGNASVADLAVKIVTSRQFRNHAGESPAAGARDLQVPGAGGATR